MSSVNPPQAGIFVEGTRLHRYIELELPPVAQLSDAAQKAIRQFVATCVLAEQPNRQRAVYQMLAFSHEYWGALVPAADKMPTQLQDFPGYRRSTAFVQGEQSGLFFLAFSTELSRFEVLLNRMYGHHQRGVHDRLLHYSQPISGAYRFAPGQQAPAALV